MGTTFRLLSTGQTYRVEDYGWALSGRNTIDLYMSNRSDMNTWGARQEPIQVLHWGDPQQSLQILQSHADHKHIKRMVLELQGRNEGSAALTYGRYSFYRRGKADVNRVDLGGIRCSITKR